MKLPKNSHGHTRTRPLKPVTPKAKIPWQLLGLTDPAEDEKSISMDEVRSQVVQMSSLGFRVPVRSPESVPSAIGNGTNKLPKPRRRARG